MRAQRLGVQSRRSRGETPAPGAGGEWMGARAEPVGHGDGCRPGRRLDLAVPHRVAGTRESAVCREDTRATSRHSMDHGRVQASESTRSPALSSAYVGAPRARPGARRAASLKAPQLRQAARAGDLRARSSGRSREDHGGGRRKVLGERREVPGHGIQMDGSRREVDELRSLVPDRRGQSARR